MKPERKIPRIVFEQVMASPEQVVPDEYGNPVYQSRFVAENGKTYLLRVFINDTLTPVLVKSVYVTSLRWKVLEGEMKLSYDPEADSLWIRWNTEPIEESDEVEPGVVFDFNADGNVVGIEVLNASIKIDGFVPGSFTKATAMRG